MLNLNDYTFTYNAAAHFMAQDKYPDGLMDAITRDGLAGYEAICWALETLSTQGELIRRDMGHDHKEYIRRDTAFLHLKPAQVLEAKKLLVDALVRGLKTDDEDDEVDEVLVELQKKTGPG